jgi:uncharacterized iron-regulated membrane protein
VTAPGLVAVFAYAMLMGLVSGSALWWRCHVTLVGRLRERFGLRWRRLINCASALVLACFAIRQLSLLFWLR